MSTNSMIGYQRRDGKIRAVYCHWDGYPEGVGQALLEHHKGAREALRLVSLGDISVLAGTDGTLAPRGKNGCLDGYDGLGIVTYNRWRREGTPQHGTLYDNAVEYLRGCQYAGAEYFYLYVPNRGWFVASAQDKQYVKLAHLVQSEEALADF